MSNFKGQFICLDPGYSFCIDAHHVLGIRSPHKCPSALELFDQGVYFWLELSGLRQSAAGVRGFENETILDVNFAEAAGKIREARVPVTWV